MKVALGCQPVHNFELFTKREHNILVNVPSATINNGGERHILERVLQAISTERDLTTTVLEWEKFGVIRHVEHRLPSLASMPMCVCPFAN